MFSDILTRLVALLLSLASPLLTLNSIELVDDYPLYTMHVYGHADTNSAIVQAASEFLAQHSAVVPAAVPNGDSSMPAWGCTLFAALADSESLLYGRNFDWRYSPAMLVTYDPPDGYASVSMVDIDYFGFQRDTAGDIPALSLVERAPLLDTVYSPFDGMNEHGLAIGMAAVPFSAMPHDPIRSTIGSLSVIREVLDHARTVDEALTIFDAYNLDWTGGPPVHYLIADRHGDTVLVEFFQGEMVVTRNSQPWDVATNFLRAEFPDKPEDRCVRYRTIGDRLAEHEGQLTPDVALAMLAMVAQSGGSSTQWSVVYDMSAGAVHVVMGRAYTTVHTFDFALAEDVIETE